MTLKNLFENFSNCYPIFRTLCFLCPWRETENFRIVTWFFVYSVSYVLEKNLRTSGLLPNFCYISNIGQRASPAVPRYVQGVSHVVKEGVQSPQSEKQQSQVKSQYQKHPFINTSLTNAQPCFAHDLTLQSILHSLSASLKPEQPSQPSEYLPEDTP